MTMDQERTVAEVIGMNVKRLRTDRGLTAPEVGRLLGDVLGKVWARQTVYQVEAGDRAMAAEEVAAFAHVLDCPVADLLAVPDDVGEVRIGELTVPAAEWRVLPAASSVDDLVHLRLFHAAQDVKNSMRTSEALFNNLVRDVTTHARTSSALRERIEQDYEIGRERTRRELSQLDEGGLAVADKDVDQSLSAATETAREVLKSLGRE
ncbi:MULTISPECIES: helix-turn-helix domain-containing protein [unclassified Brachybacterium]|uniref:helix-turn-helix domain-containing protein n=1 Tax=unclassified Brachybacterium TaxID=2623841 RepID=UPI00403360E0